jgi:hypothetical protein
MIKVPKAASACRFLRDHGMALAFTPMTAPDILEMFGTGVRAHLIAKLNRVMR